MFPAGHPFACSWEPNTCVSVEIAPTFITSACGDVSAKGIELEPHCGLEDVFLANMIITLRNEARVGCPSGPTYGETLGAMLAAHLVRHYSVSVPQAARRANASLRLGSIQQRKVLAYIEAHIDTELHLQELADVAGLDMYRFVRAFKMSLGVPPHFYIIQRRVDRSKDLLLHSTLALGVIAHRCGFSTPSHFAHTFRRITGFAPSAYRQGT
jgi:AraC family transcriptional regulator